MGQGTDTVDTEEIILAAVLVTAEKAHGQLQRLAEASARYTTAEREGEPLPLDDALSDFNSVTSINEASSNSSTAGNNNNDNGNNDQNDGGVAHSNMAIAGMTGDTAADVEVVQEPAGAGPKQRLTPSYPSITSHSPLRPSTNLLTTALPLGCTPFTSFRAAYLPRLTRGAIATHWIF